MATDHQAFPHPPRAAFEQPGVWSLELEQLWSYGRGVLSPRSRAATLDLTQANAATQAYRTSILEWIDGHPDQDYFRSLEHDSN